MKRYEPMCDCDGRLACMEESPTGDYYSRADLIAAGVLVPVPDTDVGYGVRLVKLEDVG